MFCTKCGSQLSTTARFCKKCGNSVGIPTVPNPHYSVPKSPNMYSSPVTGKSSKAVFVTTVAIILLAGGIFALWLVFWPIGESRDLDARIMSVFRVDGVAVSLQNLGGIRTDVRAGMGLHAGYALSTGFDSFCYISLDADSIVKMDVSTDVSIAQLTDRLLRINIDRGQVMVNLQNQSPEHELEAIIGNTVISVRGTLFIAGVYAGGEAIITVLDGSVYVNEVPLEAGYTMRVYDGLEMIYEIAPLLPDYLDDFALRAVLEHQDRLSDTINLEGISQDDPPFATYELFAAYLGVLQSAVAEHGIVNPNDDGGVMDIRPGVQFARLVDFGGNGIPELFYVYATYGEWGEPFFFTARVFSYSDVGVTEMTGLHLMYARGGTGRLSFSLATTEDGRAYLGVYEGHWGGGAGGGFYTSYYTIQNNTWVRSLSLWERALGMDDPDELFDESYDGFLFYVNGERVSWEVFYNAPLTELGIIHKYQSSWENPEVVYAILNQLESLSY